MKQKFVIIAFVILAIGIIYKFRLGEFRNDIKIVDQTAISFTLFDDKSNKHIVNLDSYISSPDETLGEIAGKIELIVADDYRNRVYVVYSNSGLPGRNGLTNNILSYDLFTKELQPLLYNEREIYVNNPSDLRLTQDFHYLKLNYGLSDGACSLITGTLTWDLNIAGSSSKHDRRIEKLSDC